ncbi:MAG: hypothetical protein IJF80_00795 [Clostridia bacterium]|nr:hypothetical protein [Clostridia bacterium]
MISCQEILLHFICSTLPKCIRNNTGKPWQRLFTGFFQGSLLLPTQGQHRLSDVQANDKCLIMHPTDIMAKQPANAAFVAQSALIRRAFPVSLSIQLSMCTEGKYPSLHCRKNGKVYESPLTPLPKNPAGE